MPGWVSDASAALIDAVAERQNKDQPQTRNSQPTIVGGGQDVAILNAKRSAMQNALLHRCDTNVKLEEAGREFRGMRLVDMAREFVEMAGGNARGMTPQELARAALGCDRQAVRAAGMTVTRKLKYLRGHALRVTTDGKGNGGMDIDFATLIDLGAKMVGQPPAFLEEMGEDDQTAVIEEARDFLLKHLGTGSQA